MHHPTDRIAHTTAFVTPVVEHWLEREIAQLAIGLKSNRRRYINQCFFYFFFFFFFFFVVFFFFTFFPTHPLFYFIFELSVTTKRNYKWLKILHFPDWLAVVVAIDNHLRLSNCCRCAWEPWRWLDTYVWLCQTIIADCCLLVVHLQVDMFEIEKLIIFQPLRSLITTNERYQEHKERQMNLKKIEVFLVIHFPLSIHWSLICAFVFSSVF